MLNPDLDVLRLRAEYAKDQRVRIHDLLAADVAQQVFDDIMKLPFDYLFFGGGSNRVASEAEITSLTPEQTGELQQELIGLASQGVGFLYRGYRMEGDKVGKAPASLQRLFDVLKTDILKLVVDVTGRTELCSANGQFTRYDPGNFLTRHSDKVEVENRQLAYVLNMTETWHPDWGGLLQFYHDTGDPRDAWPPRFNSLSLFDVEHVHSVTYVAPHALVPRYALTGWFSDK